MPCPSALQEGPGFRLFTTALVCNSSGDQGGIPLWNTEPLLTVAQVAAILQIREKLVRNHIKEKRLKAVKIGKYWRIKSEDLSDFIEGKTGNRMSESTAPSQLDGDDPDLTPDSESL